MERIEGEGGIMAFLSKWRPKHLLLSWAAYWVGAAAIKLSPAIIAAWRVARLEEHGGISASYGNTGLQLTITQNGATVWHGATQLGTLALWVAGPPLLLWFLWLLTRNRAERTAPAMTERDVPLRVGRGAHALGEGAAGDVRPARRGGPEPAEGRPRPHDDRRIR